ncbi:uncharacterized protein BKCO1_1700093 [Diplodia corticola]|uniref:Uncharacterized protein n=1 Tax=Diplodia corticola TaxID=236234 RepID=A0A1J9R4B7_9PEZI|nr:uncharacterized protein BKCO1_1700093 [Diplodia corticola]OJD35425.1 hypothetical protein BKCO1_1700093 [Diplodia corticola]
MSAPGPHHPPPNDGLDDSSKRFEQQHEERASATVATQAPPSDNSNIARDSQPTLATGHGGGNSQQSQGFSLPSYPYQQQGVQQYDSHQQHNVQQHNIDDSALQVSTNAATGVPSLRRSKRVAGSRALSSMRMLPPSRTMTPVSTHLSPIPMESTDGNMSSPHNRNTEPPTSHPQTPSKIKRKLDDSEEIDTSTRATLTNKSLIEARAIAFLMAHPPADAFHGTTLQRAFLRHAWPNHFHRQPRIIRRDSALLAMGPARLNVSDTMWRAMMDADIATRPPMPVHIADRQIVRCDERHSLRDHSPRGTPSVRCRICPDNIPWDTVTDQPSYHMMCPACIGEHDAALAAEENGEKEGEGEGEEGQTATTTTMMTTTTKTTTTTTTTQTPQQAQAGRLRALLAGGAWARLCDACMARSGMHLMKPCSCQWAVARCFKHRREHLERLDEKVRSNNAAGGDGDDGGDDGGDEQVRSNSVAGGDDGGDDRTDLYKAVQLHAAPDLGGETFEGRRPYCGECWEREATTARVPSAWKCFVCMGVFVMPAGDVVPNWFPFLDPSGRDSPSGHSPASLEEEERSSPASI